jgi:NaMN:DMB phosphoribosyltransferase
MGLEVPSTVGHNVSDQLLPERAMNGLMRMMTVIGAVVLAGFTQGAAAQAARNYPDKPIRLIVPYPPGGTADLLARVIGQ